MKNSEISKQLALAIGYAPEHVDVQTNFLGRDSTYVFRPYEAYQLSGDPKRMPAGLWQRFNYTDWQTIAPIAEQYDCFPQHYNEGWYSYVGSAKGVIADSAQKAIAMSVIENAKTERTK